MIEEIKKLLWFRKCSDPTTGFTFEVFKDARDEWRWRLRAANNKIIANSGEGYKHRAGCLHGIALVKSSHQATLAVIKDR